MSILLYRIKSLQMGRSDRSLGLRREPARTGLLHGESAGVLFGALIDWLVVRSLLW